MHCTFKVDKEIKPTNKAKDKSSTVVVSIILVLTS